MFKTLVYLLFFASISTSLLSAPNYGTIAQYVANLIQNNHYSRTDFEDEVSEKFLESYLKFLDSNKLYFNKQDICLLYTSPSPRDRTRSRMPSSA